jgi:1-acyl-sn-glycerol-3-phosphate acyltransferase
MVAVFLRLFKWLYVCYALLVFLALLLLAFPSVAAISIFKGDRAGNLVFRLCNIWADIWFLLIGIRSKSIYEIPLDTKRHYIYVANHISYLDAAVIAKVMRHPIRILAKVESAKIPLFGFVYKKATVTVDRSSPENRAQSVEILKKMLARSISIFIFPEGTFNMGHEPLKDFYDGAFRIALETRTPIKPILILDTYERMHYDSVFSLNPGICRTVFLEEIPVDDLGREDIPILKERVYRIMEQKLLFYRAAWIDEGNFKATT